MKTNERHKSIHFSEQFFFFLLKSLHAHHSPSDRFSYFNLLYFENFVHATRVTFHGFPCFINLARHIDFDGSNEVIGMPSHLKRSSITLCRTKFHRFANRMTGKNEHILIRTMSNNVDAMRYDAMRCLPVARFVQRTLN